MHPSPLIERAITLVRAADPDAVRLLYAYFAPAALAAASELGADPAEADDLVRLTFARLPASIHAFAAESSGFEAWLRTQVRDAGTPAAAA